MKAFINSWLRRVFGVQVVRTRGPTNVYGLDWGESARSSIEGTEVNTIIDIGAAHGTPYLYELAPEAMRVLIEPVPECNPDLEPYTKHNGGIILNYAIGDRKETRSFFVDRRRTMKSSLHARTQASDDIEERKIRVMPLRHALTGTPVVAPLLIKIDVEGHEVEALRGCEEFLDRTSALIIEATVGDRFFRHEDSLRPIDSIMKRHGFVLVNVLSAVVTKNRKENTVSVSKVDLLYLNTKMD